MSDITITSLSGDNGKIVSTDYNLGDYGEVFLQLLLMPKQNNIIKHYSQYTDKDYYSFCTGFSGMNAFATINDYDFTEQDKREVFELAKSRGYVPGRAWSRSEGWITVMKRWNQKFPTNKALIFTVSLFSPEFNAYIDKFGIAGVSLSVDGDYRQDVRDNLVLDSSGPFDLLQGHATCIMKDGVFKCIDSVSRNYTNLINTPMEYVIGDNGKIDVLKANKNLRKDCHIIIMENWLNKISVEERARLEKFKGLLEQAITLNSEMWNLTTTDSEKEERHRQNTYNRGKLAIINAILA